jgi:hypothetical protein
MSQTVVERGTSTPPVPLASPGELLPYVLLGGIVLMIVIYFVGGEEGATSIIGGRYVHELVHDARHLLGFPCH